MSAATATLQFRIARRVARSILARAFQIETEGFDRIPRGNYILAANHLGRLDPFLILATFPPHPRIHFLAAWETSQGSRKRFLSTFFGGLIPVRRGQGRLDEDALAAVHQVLRQGGVVALFPEGTYGRREGELIGPLRHGAAFFALESGRPILPVGIGGTSALHWDRRFRVRVGHPIPVNRVAAPTEVEAEALMAQVEAALLDLIEPAPELPPSVRGEFLNRLLGGPGRFGASLDSSTEEQTEGSAESHP